MVIKSRPRLTTLVFAAGSLTALFGTWRAHSTGGEVVDGQIAGGRGASYYAAVFEEAFAQGDMPLALAAAEREVHRFPRRAGGWHRLAMARTQMNATPDADALMALLTAYDLAPFRPPQEMVWRVNFAARYWPYIPDVLGQATLTQIDALAQIPGTWTVRSAWCWDLRVSALKDRACATRAADKASGGEPVLPQGEGG